jgi:hypothetical protein
MRTILGLRMTDMNYFLEAQDTINPIRSMALNGTYKKRVPQVLTIVGTLEYCINEDFPRAFDCLEKALSISQELGDLASSAAADYWLGYALSLDCKFEKAALHIEKCLEYNMAVKHLSRVSTMKSLQSYLNAYLHGSLNLAYEISRDAIGIAEESADAFSKTFAYSCHGIACYGKGFLEKARTHLSKGLGFAEKIDHHYWQPAANHFLGEICFETGEYEKAKDYFEKAVCHLEQYGYLPSWLNLNRIALARVNAFCERADFDFQRIKAHVSQNRVKQYQGWMKRLMGKLLLSTKDQPLLGAEDWIKQSLDADNKNGMRFHLGLDHALYAEFFKGQAEISKARHELDKAVEIFKECGADGWVKKYEAEMANLT